MKPIPAPSSHDDGNSEPAHVSAADLLKSTNYSNINRRSSPQATVNQAYPILLVLSTCVAIFFGVLYITKPYTGTNPVPGESTNDPTGELGQPSSKPGLLPRTDSLPGETPTDDSTHTAGNLNTAPIHSLYEETNMRVQHILTATSEDGHISRIDLEVPVLYQSRNLRWTPTEVARAGDLMVRLMDYQDKSLQLRSQGEQLLNDWNALISSSIPTSRLRADSPSVPENQQAILSVSDPDDSTTSGAVEIDSKEDQP